MRDSVDGAKGRNEGHIAPLWHDWECPEEGPSEEDGGEGKGEGKVADGPVSPVECRPVKFPMIVIVIKNLGEILGLGWK